MGGGRIKEQIFNKNAFIDFDNFKNIDDLISFIKYLDNDENAYLAMLNKPLILDKNITDKHYRQLAGFLYRIFSDKMPFRRGFGQWRLNLEKRYIRFQKTRETTNKIIDLYRKAIFLDFFKKLKGAKIKSN